MNLVPISATQPWQNQGSATRWLLSAFGSRPWFSQTTPQGVATRMQWVELLRFGMLLITTLVKNQVISRFIRFSSWYSCRMQVLALQKFINGPPFSNILLAFGGNDTGVSDPWWLTMDLHTKNSPVSRVSCQRLAGNKKTPEIQRKKCSIFHGLTASWWLF